MVERPVCPQLVVQLVVEGCEVELCRFADDEVELLGPLRMLDHLARMQLAALRCGARIRVVELPTSIAEVIDIAGLTDALGIGDDLGRPAGPPLAG